MIISAVAIRRARSLADGCRSPIPHLVVFFSEKQGVMFYKRQDKIYLSTAFHNRVINFYFQLNK